MIVNFILKYWLVIIIGGIIVLMMIIGYLANENSLVEKRERKPKKPKKEKQKKSKTTEIVEDSEATLNTENTLSQDPMDDLDENTELTEFLNDVPFEEKPAVSEEESGEVQDSGDEPFEYNFDDDNTANAVQEEPEFTEDENNTDESDVQTEDEQLETPQIDDSVADSDDESFEQFEELYNTIIHEKPLISDELKKYIEEFQVIPESLKKQKKEVLSDVKLPTIKDKKINDDIWDV